MKLNYSATSPYVRKVMVLAKETNLDGMIDCIETDVWDEQSGLRQRNPLGKVPALETDDGMVLFDSAVICAYLDTLHGGQRFIPVAEQVHWQVLRIQAVSDGIMDAAFQSVMETSKREADARSDFWLDRYNLAMNSGIDWLADHFDEFAESLNFAPICVAVALGYVDFRHAELGWRERHGEMADWIDKFNQRESMKSTNPAA